MKGAGDTGSGSLEQCQYQPEAIITGSLLGADAPPTGLSFSHIFTDTIKSIPAEAR